MSSQTCSLKSCTLEVNLIRTARGFFESGDLIHKWQAVITTNITLNYYYYFWLSSVINAAEDVVLNIVYYDRGGYLCRQINYHCKDIPNNWNTSSPEPAGKQPDFILSFVSNNCEVDYWVPGYSLARHNKFKEPNDRTNEDGIWEKFITSLPTHCLN